jgi:hypothetical protein
MLNNQENQKKKSNSEILRNALVNSVCKTVCFDLIFTAAFEGYTGLTKYTLGKGLLAVSIYGVRELTNEFMPKLSIPVGFVAGGMKGFFGLSMEGALVALANKDYLYNALNNFSYETSKTFFDKTFFDNWVATPIIECTESLVKKVIKGELIVGNSSVKDRLLKDVLHITGISTLATGIYVEAAEAARFFASVASVSMFRKYSDESFAIMAGIGLIASRELFNHSNLRESYEALYVCFGLAAASYCFATQYKLGKRIVESFDKKDPQLFMMSTAASSALAACAEIFLPGSNGFAVLGVTVSSLLSGACMQSSFAQKVCKQEDKESKLKIS